MAPNGQRQDTRYWYKISLDAVRAWATLVALVAIAIGGFWGYTLLSSHFLEREILFTIEESEELLERFGSERKLDAHRAKVDAAVRHLEGAKSLFDQKDLHAARDEAERSRTLLMSVSDALRQRSPDGEARFIATQGRVEVRRGERGEWTQARSRTVLHLGDYVKTSGNSSAEVMMVDGTLFTVRPNTVLLITRTRSALGLRSERTLSLESGWVNLSTAQVKGRIKTPEAEATLEERSEAVVAYDDQAGTGTFSSYRGDLQIAAQDGTVRTVGALEHVVQRGGGLSEARPLPEAPVLTRPEDNLEFELRDSSTIQLSWQPVKRAESYALQISQSRFFVDNIVDVDRRTKTTATLGMRGQGSFVWRVAALDSQGQRGPWSTIHRFKVGAPVAEPLSSTNQIPNQGG